MYGHAVFTKYKSNSKKIIGILKINEYMYYFNLASYKFPAATEFNNEAV